MVTESILMTGVVNAKESRHVAVLDIANAFLQAGNGKAINMLLRVEQAEMVVRIDPTLYREYVTYSTNGVPVMYVRLSRALYGMLRAVLLFYKRLQSDLENMGFEINPHNPCVTNMMANRGQITPRVGMGTTSRYSTGMKPS